MIICYLYIFTVLFIIEIYIVTLYYQDEKHLEETIRMQNVISLRNRRLDVYDFIRSPSIHNLEDRLSFLTTFKGIPV